MLINYRDEYRHQKKKKNMKCVILVIILSRKCEKSHDEA